MKRILMLLTVVALMVVMLAMSVAPAFGAKAWSCVDPADPLGRPIFVNTKAQKELLEAQGYECTKQGKPPKP